MAVKFSLSIYSIPAQRLAFSNTLTQPLSLIKPSKYGA